MSEQEAETFNLSRADVKSCRGCEVSAEGVEFRGAFNQYGSHLKSESGWWLRINHHYDYTMDGRKRLTDTIGEVLCPVCLKAHNERMGAFIDEVLSD